MIDLISTADVRRILKVSQPTLRALANEADFPKPVMLGKRWQRWREDEIRAWLAAR